MRIPTRKTPLATLLILLAGVSTTDAIAQATPSPSEARLIELLKADIPQILRLVGTPGLNLAIARRGEVIWEAGFGFADLERQVPMTAATVTHSGSMGKTYTAIAAMQLVEQGLLDLDAPVNRYLPGWTITNPLGGREVTVRDLFTHRSGLGENAAWSVLRDPKPLATHLREAYARERNDFHGGALAPTWTARAGEKFQYSNLGIATLGYIVEATNPEKLAFSNYVQRHIIDPLGMTSTQFPPVQDSAHIRPAIWEKMSRGYAGLGPTRIPTPTIYFEDHPAGTVVTKPSDHIRVLLALQHEGFYKGYQLLKPESVRAMLTPYQDTGGEASEKVGLVWFLKDWDKPYRSFDHEGAHMWGWTNYYGDFPGLDLAVAVFTNQWSLPDRDQGAGNKERQLIVDMVRTWVERDLTGNSRSTPAHSWAWKVSYVQGLMLVESINGLLGIRERLSATDIDRMVRGAAPRFDRYARVMWDPAGFRAGISDMAAAELTPAGIAAFLASDRLKVLPEELPLIFLELGGKGNLTDPKPR